MALVDRGVRDHLGRVSEGSARPPTAPAQTGPERFYVCVGCGAPMIEIGCKIRCRACGYFEDCGNGLTPPPVDARPI